MGLYWADLGPSSAGIESEVAERGWAGGVAPEVGFSTSRGSCSSTGSGVGWGEIYSQPFFVISATAGGSEKWLWPGVSLSVESIGQKYEATEKNKTKWAKNHKKSKCMTRGKIYR